MCYNNKCSEEQIHKVLNRNIKHYMKGELFDMKFLKWLLGTVLIDPLILLFLWNVIIVPMFGAGHTTFKICLIISIFMNFLYECYLLNKE